MSFRNASHLEISGEADVGKVMEMLANMPAGERESIMAETEKHIKAAEAASTREGLIESFLAARERMRELASAPANLATITTTQSSNVKPSRLKPVPLTNCTPITISTMTIDTTHRQRFLRGKVAIADSFRQIQHIYFLLEDIRGELVRVCVYNTDRVFKLDEELAITEPFFKVALDGIPVVRVDRPQDIVPWTAPVTPKQWKQLGDEFVAAEDGSSAIHCFESFLSTPEIAADRPTLAILYNNVAICESRLGRYKSAAWYAGTAVYFDPKHTKAWFRLIDSLIRFDVGACRAVLVAAPSHPELNSLRAKAKKTSGQGEGHKFKGQAAWSSIFPAWTFAPYLNGAHKENTNTPGPSLRERAREAFQRKEFEKAKQLYVEELSRMREVVHSVAVLTASMSAAHSLLEAHHGDALLLSTVSVMLDKTNHRSWIRRSNVLQQALGTSVGRQHLEIVRDDVADCASEDWEGKKTFVAKLNSEIGKLLQKEENQSKVERVGELPTNEQLQDRNTRVYGHKPVYEDQELDEYIATRERSLFPTKQMAAMIPCTTPLRTLVKQLAARKCPKIHEEFSKHLGWPAGLNETHANKILYRGYLDASSHPWNLAMLMSSGMYPVSEGQLLIRWHGPLRASLFRQRYGSLQHGDVIDPPTAISMYDPYIRSMFVNAPSNPMTRFEAGSVHVSVGFNDLGELLSGPIVATVEAEAAATESNLKGTMIKALHFVGYEKSEFSIARSLVVKEMLLDSKVPITAVFQVWYSSGWTKSTLKHFRIACRKTVDGLSSRRRSTGDQSNHDIIASYLHCWLSEEPLKPIESRQRWFDNMEMHSHSKISDTCSLMRLSDRVAVLLYLFTGELIPAQMDDGNCAGGFAGSSSKAKKKSKNFKSNKSSNMSASSKEKVKREAADVGSLTFWNMPPNSAPLESLDFLDTVAAETLLEFLDSKNHSHHQNIIDSVMTIKLKQLHLLRKKLLDGEVIMDVRYGDVNLNNAALLHEIALLNPRTMSWSNLLDYSSHRFESFHRVARRFNSVIRHYGYSMNWVATVYGGCLTDYLYDKNEVMINRLLIEALSCGSQNQRQNVIVAKPLFDTPLNLVGYVLSHKIKGSWIEYFGSSAEGIYIVESRILQEFPLHRNTRALFLEWKYSTK